jgi:hypothetical protein
VYTYANFHFLTLPFIRERLDEQAISLWFGGKA